VLGVTNCNAPSSLTISNMKIREILFPAAKIIIVLVSIILVVFLVKYLYQILNNILETKPLVLEGKVISFEIEKLEKFISRLGIEMGE